MMDEEARNMNVSKNDDEEGVMTTTRIFVGGLGASVTADDIRKTFSPLGAVKGVDVIRTKGRSFAYMDFYPSSDQALSKLFSMYNGCVWKGGRLKLERAKEHYLVCLRREWAEDQRLASMAANHDMGADKKMVLLEKPKKDLKSKEVIRLYFPKLRKVKSLPLNGTGKHKYSFQRTEVPAFPIHFCDCEEHSDPSQAFHGKQFCNFETQNSGVKEEEFHMMTSIMNKLFVKESNVKAVSDSARHDEELDSSVESDADLLPHENEDILIVNMVAGGNGRKNLMCREQQILSADQFLDSRSAEMQSSVEKSTKNAESIKDRKAASSSNKRNSVETEVSDVNEHSSPIPKKKGRLQSAQPSSGKPESTGGSTWSQKSSWRKLVDTNEINQFSVSSMLQSRASTNDNLKMGTLDATGSKSESSVAVTLEALEGQLEEIFEQAGCQSTEPYVSNKTTNGNGTCILHTLQKMDSTDREVKMGSRVDPDNDLLSAGRLETFEDHSKEMVSDSEPTESNVVSNKTARGTSWQQKSSWTQMVGDLNTNSFSITQIVPAVNLRKEEPAKPNSNTLMKSSSRKHFDIKQNCSEPAGDDSKGFGLDQNGPVGFLRCSEVDHEDEKGQNTRSHNTNKQAQHTAMDGKVPASTVNKRHCASATQGPPIYGDFGETCTFMRSSASLKEWAKIRAALSGSHKRSNDPVIKQ